MDDIHYSIYIHWSHEDNLFIATLPEFPNCSTHGNTYEEALQNGKEVLEMLIEKYQALGQPLPQPRSYAAA
jgi:predicted RNase H-like HicB family nuclease